MDLSQRQLGRFTSALSNTLHNAAETTASAWRRVTRAIQRFNTLGHNADAWPSVRAATRFNTTLILAWGVFCSSVLIPTGHFTYDQAYFYEHAVRVAESFRWPAYGPFVSGITPSPLTPGGMLYVALSVPFFFVRDPRIGVAWLHILAAFGAWLFDRSLRILRFAPAIRIATIGLYVMSIAHARAEETFWNGDMFLFATPALLSCTTTIITQSRDRLWPYFGFGALSALSIQTHLSGGMAMLVCLSIVLVRRPSALRLKGAVAIGVALAACYLPYFIIEASTGYPNSVLLRAAVPSGRYSTDAMLRSLISPILYTAHIEFPSALLNFSSNDWVMWVALVTGWIAVAVCVLGLFVRQPLKFWSIGIVLALPLYFRLTGRPYYDHYVATIVPFVCVIPGAGLGWIIAQAPRLRIAGLAYLGAYAVAGIAILLTQLHRPVLHPADPWNGQTVALQLERAQAALDAGKPIRSGPGDDGAFIASVLAKRVLGKELIFRVNNEQKNCKVDLDLSGFGRPRPTPTVIALGNNSVFRCE